MFVQYKAGLVGAFLSIRMASDGCQLRIVHTCSNAVPTTCQQDVFAMLVSSLLTTCYKVNC
jgi:hypothetical protein